MTHGGINPLARLAGLAEQARLAATLPGHPRCPVWDPEGEQTWWRAYIAAGGRVPASVRLPEGVEKPAKTDYDGCGGAK